MTQHRSTYVPPRGPYPAPGLVLTVLTVLALALAGLAWLVVA